MEGMTWILVFYETEGIHSYSRRFGTFHLGLPGSGNEYPPGKSNTGGDRSKSAILSFSAVMVA